MYMYIYVYIHIHIHINIHILYIHLIYFDVFDCFDIIFWIYLQFV